MTIMGGQLRSEGRAFQAEGRVSVKALRQGQLGVVLGEERQPECLEHSG